MVSHYLLCYDIADHRRLARLHRFLARRAQALQYSVFLFQGDDRQLQVVLDAAAELIDPRVDDLRAYPLPSHGLRWRLGKATLPAGIVRGDMPAGW